MSTGTRYPRSLDDLEGVLKFAMERNYPVTFSYWEHEKDDNGKPIMIPNPDDPAGKPVPKLTSVIRTVETYEIDTAALTGKRYIRGMTRIAGSGETAPRTYRLERFGTHEPGHLTGCITIHRSLYMIPRPDVIDAVLLHAIERGDKPEWAAVVELWTTAGIWARVRRCLTKEAAVQRMADIIERGERTTAFRWRS